MEYGSNAKTNAALATGIIGTVLGGLNSAGGLTALHAGTGEETAVTRHELNYVQEIANKDHTIAQLTSQQYTDTAIKNLSDQMAVKFNQIDQNLNAQSILNTQQTATMQCMQNNINLLMSMTKVIIPNSNVMPGWGDVTITPAGSTLIKGAVSSSASAANG